MLPEASVDLLVVIEDLFVRKVAVNDDRVVHGPGGGGRRATVGPRATGLGPRPMKRQLRIPAHKWLIGGSPWFL